MTTARVQRGHLIHDTGDGADDVVLSASARERQGHPVCAEAEPCYLPAARTAIAFLRNGRVAARTRTRADGTYRIRLAAGRYTIRVGGGRRWSPPAALVRRGRTARVDISIDTGIR